MNLAHFLRSNIFVESIFRDSNKTRSAKSGPAQDTNWNWPPIVVLCSSGIGTSILFWLHVFSIPKVSMFGEFPLKRMLMKPCSFFLGRLNNEQRIIHGLHASPAIYHQKWRVSRWSTGQPVTRINTSGKTPVLPTENCTLTKEDRKCSDAWTNDKSAAHSDIWRLLKDQLVLSIAQKAWLCIFCFCCLGKLVRHGKGRVSHSCNH